MEWADATNGFASGARLTQIDTSDYFIGPYNGDTVLLNPMVSSNPVIGAYWPNNQQSYYVYNNPMTQIPGEIGTAIFKSQFLGPF